MYVNHGSSVATQTAFAAEAAEAVSASYDDAVGGTGISIERMPVVPALHLGAVAAWEK